MSSSRRIDTAEFKQEAVLMVTQQGLSPAEAAGRLGIRANLLRRWKQELAKQGSPSNPRQPTALEAPRHLNTEIGDYTPTVHPAG